MLYAKTPEFAARAFLAMHPRTDTSQITVEPTSTGRRHSHIFHYRACDITPLEGSASIADQLLSNSTHEAQKVQDIPSTQRDPKTCGECSNVFSGYGNVCPRCGAPVRIEQTIPEPTAVQSHPSAGDVRRAPVLHRGFLVLHVAAIVSGVILFIFSHAADDEAGRHLTPASVHVSGYYRRDGTYINSYHRRPAGGVHHDAPYESSRSWYSFGMFVGVVLAAVPLFTFGPCVFPNDRNA